MIFEYLPAVSGIYLGIPFLGFCPSVRIVLFDTYEFCLFRLKIMSRDMQGFYVTIFELAVLSFSLEIGYQESIWYSEAEEDARH